MKCGMIELVRLGEMAFCAGKELTDNPHEKGSLSWANWRYGWLKAAREVEP